MQLGRQDIADKSYLPPAELKSYTPKRTGKDLSTLLAKEGGVQVRQTSQVSNLCRIFVTRFYLEMLTTCRSNCRQTIVEFKLIIK
jgi:hypothetical protein